MSAEILLLGAHFAVRLPRDRQIRLGGEWLEMGRIPMESGGALSLRNVDYTKDEPLRCHVAIRRLPPGKAKDPQDDTWYVATDADDVLMALTWYEKRFQIEEMFRDLKGELNIDRHRLGTEASVGKMMLIATLAYLVTLEDGLQWRSRVDLSRIQKTTARGKMSIYGVASACFDICLPEAPDETAEIITSHWSNRRAA